MIRRLVILFFFVIISSDYLCKAGKADSLLAANLKANDSIRAFNYSEIVKEYIYTNYDSALKYAVIGKNITSSDKVPDLHAFFLNSIASIHLEKGEYSEALSYYIEAEKQYKLVGNQKQVLAVNLNVGLVYQYQNLLDKALTQFEAVLESAKSNNYTEIIANSFNSIGSVYYAKGDKLKALDAFKESLEINKSTNNLQRIMEGLNNVAIIYQEIGQYSEALENFHLYLKFSKQTDDMRSQVIAYHNIAMVHMEEKNIFNAIQYLDSSIVVANNIKDFENLIEIYDTYTKLFKDSKNYEKAFETFQLKAAAQDSLLKQTRDKQFIEMSTKYDTEKKEAENKILKATSETQKAINTAITIGLILVAALAFFIFRGYNEKKKANTLLAEQNTEIKEQKSIIEEKQKEILDSITYAKRLQEAILPPVSHIKKHLPDSFIYYKPKDIVAGDFYWMEHKDNITFIAAADCTGHGVPGAMVSVVCSNALNRAVLEFNLTDPGQILDKTRELVSETYAKSDSDVKDGMDISLCAINKTNNIIKWAGANNPLWYTNNHHINEITANKQPIGKVDIPVPFTTHQIQLSKGDSIFLFTDGLPDQFGGPKGKKFKYKQFQELLISNLSSDSEKFAKNIDTTFTNWKGNLEQVDDVCVIGIRI